MKRALSYIIAGVAVLAAAAYLVFFLGLAAEKRHGLLCAGVKIDVAEGASRRFITAKDVEECIRHEYGECRGMPVVEIDLTRIEGLLRAKNAVLSAEAYTTPDGMLNVDVVQRIPALRFKNDEEEFFIDGDGYVFHLQTGGTAQVMTVEGHFPVKVEDDFQGRPAEEADREWLNAMLTLADRLKRTEMWEGVSLGVRENGDIVLTPAEGHPQFVFGKPENFGSKFGRLAKYHSVIVPAVGAEHYSTVSLKYEGQIVCREEKNPE